MKNKFPIGQRVMVTEGAGSWSGLVGVVVPRSFVPMRKDGSGIPAIEGHYDFLKKDEVVIKTDSGRIFTMFPNYLQKI